MFILNRKDVLDGELNAGTLAPGGRGTIETTALNDNIVLTGSVSSRPAPFARVFIGRT